MDVVRQAAPWFPSSAFSFIALFAITNTGLLNFVMGSRMVYGLAHQGLLPSALGKVHPKRRTPQRGILLLMCIVIALSLSGGISELASATSVLLLCAFIVVNAALIVLQRKANEPKGAFEILRLVPALGIVTCLTLLFNASTRALWIAGVILFIISGLYLLRRPKAVDVALD